MVCRRNLYKQVFLHSGNFTHRNLHTQKPLQTNIFTYRAVKHKCFFTQTLLHTEVSGRRIYTQMFLPAGIFTHDVSHSDGFTKKLYTRMPFTNLHGGVLNSYLHTGSHRFYAKFCAQMALHRRLYTRFFFNRCFYTQMPLHTKGVFTHRHFLHTEVFTARIFRTQRLWNTGAFTHRSSHTQTAFADRSFYTQVLYTQIPSLTDPFTRRASHIDVFAQKPLQTNVFFTPRSLYTHPRLCTQKLSHTGAFAQGKLLHTRTLFPQFWTIDAHFVREAFTESKPNPNFPPVFDGQHAFGGAQGVRFMSMGTAGGSKDFICVCFLEDLYACIYTPASIRLPLRTCIYTAVDTWVFPEDLDLLHTWR